jgi:ubiquitin carboxyl-terminal hydrolase 4/11/15
MASDYDPSLKRSVADTAAAGDSSLSASNPNNLSALSISDSNDDLNPASFQDNSLPTPSQKLAQVQDLNNVPMQAGQTLYLVSREWYQRWRKACSGEMDKEGPVLESDLGPVDNSSLLVNGSLIPHCIEHVDVEFVTSSVWELFEKWYGCLSITFPFLLSPFL